MKNTERINKNIVDDVRKDLELEGGDTSTDDKINSMSPNEIFERWCEWNGFINHSATFRRVIGSIYGVSIDNDSMKLKSDRDETFVIIGEILRMITSTDNHFEESMHEYICDQLDISSKYLDEIVEIVSKMNEKNSEKF